MAVAGEIAVNVVAKTRGYTGGLNRAMGQTQGFGGAVRRALGPLNSFAGRLAGIAGVSLGVAGAIRTLTGAFRRIDDIAKKGARLGLLSSELVGLRNAAELSGVASNTLDMALQRMTRRVAEAALGTGEAKAAIAELGLSAQQLNLEGPYQSFLKIADALNKVPNQSDRVRLAFKLFDSEGAALVVTLAQGSQELDKHRREAISTGQAVSADMTAKIEAANEAFAKFWQSTKGLGNTLAVKLAPAIQYVGEQLTHLAKWIGSVSISSVRMTAKIMAAAAAFTAALVVIPKLIKLAAALIKSLRSIALGLSTVRALAGPAGWATLAISLGVAVTAAVAINKAFDKIEASATGAQTRAASIANIKTEWKGLNAEMAESPVLVNAAVAATKDLTREVKRQQFAGAAARGTTEAFSAIVQGRAERQRQVEIEKQQLAQQINGNKSLDEIARHTQEMVQGMGVLTVQDLRS